MTKFYLSADILNWAFIFNHAMSSFRVRKVLENRGQADEERVGLFLCSSANQVCSNLQEGAFCFKHLITNIYCVLGQNVCFDKEKLAITGNPGFVILQP